jgi:PAS domain S-box-containing protein
MSKLLVIDDEETNVRVLSMSLRLDGHEVITATSGEEGIEIFKNAVPDIVITDIKMPGMDGITVLRNLKELRPDIEVIIVTGHGDIENAVEALKYGASDFINKPVRDEVLAIAIQRAEEKLTIKRRLSVYTHDLENAVEAATLELKRKSSFMAKLIRSSNDGIVATDRDFRIVIYNPGAKRIFGYSRDEIEHVRVTDIYPVEVMGVLENDTPPDLGAGGLPWKETTITDKNGNQIPVRFSGTLLHEKKEIVGSVAFFQDLSEIKRLEAELVRSERLAAIGQTVAGLAHGVKNILHGFKGGSYMVDMGIKNNNPDKLEKGWAMVQRNIQRTSDLVMDLLSYSKERVPEYEACDPNEIANDVCDLLDRTAHENHIDIVKRFDFSIGKTLMDPRTIHCALLNLMSNAIDACIFDQENKRWRVCLKTMKESDKEIIFEVGDNGAGMNEEVKKKLFTSFFSTKGQRGTGLGLLVTRKHIEEHGGSIKVASEPGKGTTFTIRLPYKKPPHEIKINSNAD